MVLKFRLISNEQDDFIRDFEILENQTFLQLHEAIQENLHYDKSQIASFFTCNQQWEKEQEITLFEFSEEDAAKVLVMDNTRIGDHLKDTHEKMLYVFDIFNERLFFIELVEILDQDKAITYPYCSFEQGQSPQQLFMDAIFNSQPQEESIPLSDDSLDDDSLDDEMFDEKDLDGLGFDEQFIDDSLPDEE